MKSEFEKNGGEYIECGDYMLPNLKLPAEKEQYIGVWGNRRKQYLKSQHKVLYYNLLTSGKLTAHLADIEQQAEVLFSRLVKSLAEKENITDKLKASEPMEWMRRMNNIRSCAMEIVNAEVIFV